MICWVSSFFEVPDSVIKLFVGALSWIIFSPFRDWQAEFGQNLFHILPDPLAVFLRVISQKVGSMVCRHKFYRCSAEAGIVFVELPS